MPMLLFTIATLAPVALIAAGALAGAPWVWLGLLWMTMLTAMLDALVRRVLPTAEGEEFPAANALSVAIALSQLALMALVVAALSGANPGRWGPGGWGPGGWELAGPELGGWEKLALFLAAGLFFGQVGNANAHELIHRTGRGLRGLGIAAYVSVLFGHHASAHVLVHHVRAATRDDPNSARRGEGFWRFLPRAWAGSFREGLRTETVRRRRAGKPVLSHPYVIYLGGALITVAIAATIGGWRGVLWLLALAGYAQIQILMADYVQHYGLTRTIRDNGRPEPVAMRHSWNSGHPASSALMLNAPRHSDHHAHPMRPYPSLTLPQDAPLLPCSLPVMAVIATIPPLWRRVMDPRLERWQAEAPDRP